ncbi:hypothetical protein [Plantactinospora sp. CA-290183]|uniref:hypothetical protein n=1 Tax=Plantactinospora sp. CA-290183 TaxID=3240006 RepID=UPI003D8E142E
MTSPDQRKPGHRRAGQIGALVSAAALVAMIFNNNEVSGIAKLWLVPDRPGPGGRRHRGRRPAPQRTPFLIPRTRRHAVGG